MYQVGRTVRLSHFGRFLPSTLPFSINSLNAKLVGVYGGRAIAPR